MDGACITFSTLHSERKPFLLSYCCEMYKEANGKSFQAPIRPLLKYERNDPLDVLEMREPQKASRLGGTRAFAQWPLGSWRCIDTSILKYRQHRQTKKLRWGKILLLYPARVVFHWSNQIIWCTWINDTYFDKNLKTPYSYKNAPHIEEADRDEMEQLCYETNR